jgi:hypothetical protein
MEMATAEHVNHQCIREPWTTDVTALAALGRLARTYSNISQMPVIFYSTFANCYPNIKVNVVSPLLDFTLIAPLCASIIALVMDDLSDLKKRSNIDAI